MDDFSATVKNMQANMCQGGFLVALLQVPMVHDMRVKRFDLFALMPTGAMHAIEDDDTVYVFHALPQPDSAFGCCAGAVASAAGAMPGAPAAGTETKLKGL